METNIVVLGKLGGVHKTFLESMRKKIGTYTMNFMKAIVSERISHSVMSDSLWPPSTVAWQAPLPMEFSRQEYWSGLPFPSPGDLAGPGIKPSSPTLQVDSLLSEWLRKVGVERLGGICYTFWKEREKNRDTYTVVFINAIVSASQ